MRRITLLFMALVAMTSVAGDNIKAVDRENLDTSTSPGTNFYQYACGGWKLNNPLDPQYARFGTFDQLAENSRNQVKDIITTLGKNNPQGSIKQKVGDLYALGMDSVRLNKEGMQPLMNDVNKYKALTRNDFSAVIADFHNGISDPFFNSQVMADMKDSNTNMLYLMQGGLGMGDRDYYLEKDPNTVKVRNAYANYIQQLFQLIGYKKGNAKKAAQGIMAIETELAKVAMTREDSRDYSKLYNVTSVAQLKADYPNINWDQYFKGLNIQTPEKVCVFQPKSIAKVNEMFKGLKEQAIREYLIFKYIDAASPYLSDAFADANFDMYSRAMSGKQVKMPRWKHSLDVPNTLLGEAVGQLYVEKYFPADSKKKMQQLVDNLKKALGEHIELPIHRVTVHAEINRHRLEIQRQRGMVADGIREGILAHVSAAILGRTEGGKGILVQTVDWRACQTEKESIRQCRSHLDTQITFLRPVALINHYDDIVTRAELTGNLLKAEDSRDDDLPNILP